MGSFLHRLDPRTKILLVPLLSILVFIIDKLPLAVMLLFCFLALRMSVKAPFRNTKFYFKMMSAIIAFLILMQMLFGPGENYIIWPLRYEGLILGLVIGCRLVALMFLLPILNKTTSPYMIVLGLTKLGLDYRASYIITSALNLVPVFEEEARNIMDAQKLRGMKAFEEGSFFNKMKAYPSLAVPLILGAMRRAQLAGIAMDARAFGAYKSRTWLLQLKMKLPDYLSFAAFFVFTALILILNSTLK